MNQNRIFAAYSQLSKSFFVVMGGLVASSGFVFALNTGCLTCVMRYWIPGTDIIAAWVYPTSVVIIGVSFIFFGLKFGWRGIGLMCMVFGAFDVLDKMLAIYIAGLLYGSFATQAGTVADPSDIYFWEQNALIFGGFIVAGFPRLRPNRWLLLAFAALCWSQLIYWPYLVQWHGFEAYQVWEIFLFVYFYKTAELRNLPRLFK